MDLSGIIYECALKALPRLKMEAKSKEITAKTRFIEFPFDCKGVVNVLVYDTKAHRFTEIKYTRGKGQGIKVGDFSGYFEDVETCSIKL